MKTLPFLIVFCISFFSGAQEPSYYTLASKQFKGVDIYGVIQDNDLNYLFATDQGLMVHDGYSYQKKTCPKMKGSSVFGFVKDSQGTIYCYNLHQQVFRIINGEMELYFNIPDDLQHHELTVLVDHEDHLLIQTKGIIRIGPNKSSIQMMRSLFGEGSPVNFHLLDDGSTLSASYQTKFVRQKNGEVTTHEIEYASPSSSHTLDLPFSWVTIKEQVYAVDHIDLEVFQLDLDNSKLTYKTTLNQNLMANNAIRLMTTENQLWVGGITNGMYVYSHDFEPLFDDKAIYPSVFVSDILTDQEGNILLSTFGEGVRVIPNINVSSHTLPNSENILHIESDQEQSLFLSTNRGNIYQFKNGKHHLLYSDPAGKSNEGMKYWPERKILAFYSSAGALFFSWNGSNLSYLNETKGAFKNAHFSSSDGLIALNYGICEVSVVEGNRLEFRKKLGLQKRAYCVVRDERTQSIYAGLSNGLIRSLTSGKTEPVLFKGQGIFPNSLLYSDGKVYVGTRNHGILVYENDQLVGEIVFPEVIKKMTIHNNQLFVLSNRGLHISDVDGTNRRRLNNSSGLSSNYISEFHISNNVLYITDSKSTQFTSLNKLFNRFEGIPIHFKSVVVNNEATDRKNFSYDQRKIQFSFGVSSLKFRDNIHYRYKLVGYESEWQIKAYADNEVTYNALSPGKYTFMVQSVNGSTKGETISYPFTIDAPYYQQWWFYFLIFLITGLTITLFFFYRIRNIRKKNHDRLEKQKTQTDLLEFELKALRSQMNPHFIFNSLNSIQDLILKEETDASYDYIVLFADLVRSTLNHSNKDFIEIEKEIEFIKVYLSLEQLRFKEDFEYTINANGITDIKLPTLLIQPFIENALIHGLIHKEGLKRLTINFHLKEDKLTCLIRDNGIGRQKAKEIKERQGSHESFALNAIEKRLAILNQHIEYECGFTFNDLEENGKASGTEVSVTLPYKHLY